MFAIIYRKHIILLALVITLNMLNGLSIIISPRYCSLTANGDPIKITYINSNPKAVKLYLSSDLTINNNLEITYTSTFDIKKCHQTVIAKDTLTGAVDTCKISIVPWVANLSALKVDKVMDAYKILGKFGDTLFVNYKDVLYKTGDDLSKLIKIANLTPNPSNFWGYYRTPVGSFYRIENNIYFSKDEKNWHLDYTTRGRGIYNSFAYTYDSIKQITRVYCHDYTTEDSVKHSVYRGTRSNTDSVTTWEKVLTFGSLVDWRKDGSILLSTRHIHTVMVDPYTGHIWVGTGDSDQHCFIYYSEDDGRSWRIVGMGSQDWRTVSFWFTRNYVYWGTDTNPPQSIFRIPKSRYKKNEGWPNMSPLLTSGTTKIGVKYLIVKTFPTGHFTWKLPSDIWVATKAVSIDTNNIVVAIDDPALDYREKVADLSNNSLWGNSPVYDKKGDQIFLLAASAEGQAIDDRPRLFGIKERVDGSTDVQELLSTNKARSILSVLNPYEQDSKGNIYIEQYLTTELWNETLSTTLLWNDNSKSQGGYVSLLPKKLDQNEYMCNLKLLEYDGKIEKWQISNNGKDWSDYVVKDENTSTRDTINITRVRNHFLYVRAIVKKEHESPVSSLSYRIDSINTDTNSSVSNIKGYVEFTCYTNPMDNQIYITSNSQSNNSNAILEIINIDGRLTRRMKLDFSLSSTIKISMANRSHGIYVLKIANNKSIFTKKIAL